jgi:uncharacterized protein (DUF1015 family)
MPEKMATINPLIATYVNPLHVHELVFADTSIEVMAEACMEPGKPPPLRTRLESLARRTPESPEILEKAYLNINSTLVDLQREEQLLIEKEAGIYIYEITEGPNKQTGVWTLTDLGDYTAGHIKIHELTFEASVSQLTSYRKNTGLEGSPIILTYRAEETINQLIADNHQGPPTLVFHNSGTIHKFWHISDRYILRQFIAAFAAIQTVYLADGHHRLESAARLAVSQKAQGLPVYGTITSLYIASDQLQILPFHRVLIPTRPWEKYELLEALSKHYYIQATVTSLPVQLKEKHLLGMYHQKAWYYMAAKPTTHQNKSITASLDTAILQNDIFGPLFGISDPKNDHRLTYVGGRTAMEEIQEFCMHHPKAIAFTLSPLSIGELMEVADAGEILPPKSTWISPKIPYGLILYQHKPIQSYNETY